MSNERKFLFQIDPKRFWEIVHDDDPNARVAGFKDLDELLLCEVVRYGTYNREEMIGPLAKFYRGPVMRMTQEQRFGIYRHVARFVEHTSVVSPNAFLPFIAEEDAIGIVSTAVIDYVSLAPLTNRDPMSRVRDIIGMIESDALNNVGAAFGALLHIGDKRVCDLLIPLRDGLDGKAIRTATGCSTGFIHSATADFYLDWLEGLEGTDQDGNFGLVASGLGLLKKKNQLDQVSTGYRPFPTRSATPEQWREMLKPISLEQYIKRIAPRMYALERTEPPPRVMPTCLPRGG